MCVCACVCVCVCVCVCIYVCVYVCIYHILCIMHKSILACANIIFILNVNVSQKTNLLIQIKIIITTKPIKINIPVNKH